MGASMDVGRRTKVKERASAETAGTTGKDGGTFPPAGLSAVADLNEAT
jgi:hypothetical protein